MLKDKKIHVFTGKLSSYAFSVWIPPVLRIIVISKRVRSFDKRVITGLLVHELCHQERYCLMGISAYLGFAVKFLISGRVRGFEEKATDRLTIEKGYGRELYELSVLTHQDRRHKKINRYYLTPEEIKEYAISLGKWL
jgi:hypothetical protein